MIAEVDRLEAPVFALLTDAESVDGYVCRVAYIPTLPETANWSGDFGRIVGQLSGSPHCSGGYPFFFYLFSEGATQDNIVEDHYLYSETGLIEALRTLQHAGEQGLRVTFSLKSDRTRYGWFYVWY
jgi:hypothetical protein